VNLLPVGLMWFYVVRQLQLRQVDIDTTHDLSFDHPFEVGLVCDMNFTAKLAIFALGLEVNCQMES
jgi:hypothetical protein